MAVLLQEVFQVTKTQLVPLIKAALSHDGFAFIDVISPCVTFNNNKGSTKSYDFTREFMKATSTVDFIPPRDEITVDYEDGNSIEVELHDGNIVRLSKPEKDWNPFDKNSSFTKMLEAKDRGLILTGLLYINKDTPDLHEKIQTSRTPLNQLTQDDLCPGPEILESINQSFR